MELSVKGMFLLLIGEDQSQHEIDEKVFQEALSSILEGIRHVNFDRIWMVIIGRGDRSAHYRTLTPRFRDGTPVCVERLRPYMKEFQLLVRLKKR